ncbi:hypothetical protein GCM10011316_05310 [Roseibium aquae]|uniref:diguanylate cyclase n=1 Tax=Roseibium aquae TaxID=1323746 RepID=A0A916TBD6_9HYPH|nr:GGDEF domain-containing protein [Roseibium aquae]GGB36098.1 hypothetical protein GCM10011316_05310 [Roseibium aquae]
MDTLTLLAANLVLLFVFASCFFTLAKRLPGQPSWNSWARANALLAAAIACFAFETSVPPAIAILIPNMLIVLGFAYHVQGARQVADLPVEQSYFWGPATALGVVALPAIVLADYRLMYLATNLLVTALALSAVWTYWDLARQKLFSAYGLIGAFSLMAVEGLIRTGHGLLLDPAEATGLRTDLVLTTHLFTSLVFVALAGAFALCLSFERKTEEHRDAARRDPLTGIFNRREFERQLVHVLTQRNLPFAVVQFDIDHFKTVNDRFGHVAGDEALQEVAALIQNNLRGDDCFARLGGEEFAVLMPRVSELGAVKIAERIRGLVCGHIFDFAPPDFRITLSAGVIHGIGEGLTADTVMRTVDESLYQCKHTGRNRVSLARLPNCGPHSPIEGAPARQYG